MIDIASPKVSVIIPVYNDEENIERSVNSVLAQTLEDIEIIVVNDGSTDKTADRLSKFDNIIVISQENLGQGMARNAGLKVATGEYIGFVDSDDVILPDMYRQMYEVAEKNNSEVVQCAIRDVKLDEGTSSIRSAFDDVVNITSREDYVYNYFFKLNHSNEVCNKLIKKSFIVENNLSFDDTKKVFSEDFLFNMKLILKLASISYISYPGYEYYIKSSGHFLSNLVSSIEKIVYAFSVLFKEDMDKGTRDAFRCVASLTILLYSAKAIEKDEKSIKRILKSKEVRKYLKSFMVYRSNLKHFLLILSILYMPFGIKRQLLQKFYIY